jgi:hypothetical protein
VLYRFPSLKVLPQHGVCVAVQLEDSKQSRRVPNEAAPSFLAHQKYIMFRSDSRHDSIRPFRF